MNDNSHIHEWHTFTKPDTLICSGCPTVADLKTVLHNIAIDTAKTARVQVCAELVFEGSLKKGAQERIYNWVMAQNSGMKDIMHPPKPVQERLL